MNTTNPMARFRLWVLAWFLMSLGAATATPIFQPKMLDVVCTTSGTLKFFALSDDGATELNTDALNCPMCDPSVPAFCFPHCCNYSRASTGASPPVFSEPILKR